MTQSITVELSNDDGSEQVTFPVRDLLAHHAQTRSWEDLAAESYAQMSLAEDYALHYFKRRHGDHSVYRVEVISGLSDDANDDAAPAPSPASEGA